MRQYVGYRYSKDGTAEPVPVNFIEMGTSVYTANLAGGEPKSRITTPIPSLKQTSHDMQLDVNYVLKACGFKQTLEDVTREGLFGPGIVKVGIAASKNGGEFDPGEVFIDLIDLDDWVQDMAVRSYKHCGYAGHKMPMERDDLRADPDVDQDVLASLGGKDRGPNYGGDNRVESIAAGEQSNEEDSIGEEIWVLHLWMRREQLELMLPIDLDGTVQPKLLKIKPWTGPDEGPFEFVNFNRVPGNAISLPPLAVLHDLHEIINVLYNKLGRQGARQKTVTVVKDDMLKDGERQIDAGDGDAVRGDPKAVGEVNMGGADERTMGLGVHLIDRANAAGGNIESLGGIGPSADTLGQERIIKQSASQRINAMQGTISDFVTAIIKQVAYYEFTNPLLNRTLVKRIPGTSLEIPFQMTQARLSGKFIDFNFEMQAYTNKARTPADQVEAIGVIFERYVAPYQAQMAEQEISIDFGGLLRSLGELVDVDVDDFLQFGMPSSMPVQQIRGQDPRAAISPPSPSRPPARPASPQRPNGVRMIQDLMSRPQPQMAGA